LKQAFIAGNTAFVFIFFLINEFFDDAASPFMKLTVATFNFVLVFAATFLLYRFKWKSGDGLRLSRILVFLILAFAPWRHTAGPDGDVPHYHIAAYSLWFDHDLDVENNYQKNDQLYYYYKSTGGWKLPDTRMRSGVSGDHLFWPSLGIPLLDAPLSIVPHSFLINLLLANLLALSLAVLSLPSGLSGIGSFIFLLSGPWTFFSSQQTPDIMAFCFISLATYFYKHKKWTLVGFIGGLLPWLKPPFVIASVCIIFLGASGILRSPGHRSPARNIGTYLPLIMIPLLSLASLSILNYTMWGSPSISANYGTNPLLDFRNIPDRFCEYFFSLERGAIWAIPMLGSLLLQAIIGFFRKLRGLVPSERADLLIVSICSFLFFCVVMVGPNEGWNGRVRYLLPLFALLIPFFMDAMRKGNANKFYVGGLSWMAGCFILLTIVPSVWPPFGQVGYPFSFLYFEGTQKILKSEYVSRLQQLNPVLSGPAGSWAGFILFSAGVLTEFLRTPGHGPKKL
jgi:hypothetical protein